MCRGTFLALLILITAGALLFRLPNLGNRPMHGDEAVHALKFEELWKHGTYRYDPNEYHGPTIYYAALPFIIARGRHNLAETTEADFRLPIAMFGAALVLLLGLLGDGLGRRPVLYAALLIAISPAFVFYSRYYIQEMLLTFFTLAAIGYGWRWHRDRRVIWSAVWSVMAGISAGLMLATKETAVLTFGAGLAAWFLCRLWERRVERRRVKSGEWRVESSEAASARPSFANPRGAIIVALLAAIVTAWLFLSGFLANPTAPLLYLKAFVPWLQRARGLGLHRHPWYYYLQLLLWNHEKGGPIWSEGFIVSLAGIGLAAVLLPQRTVNRDGSIAFRRFLAFFAVLLTLGYSVIPYKTPWCLLSFLLAMILLAGAGAEALLAWFRPRGAKIAVGLALAAAAVQLGVQSYRTSYVAFADERNPYVYAQPGPDVEKLAQRVETLASASPERDRTIIQVLSVDNYYWPLPWYLRRFPNVGYWTEVPRDTRAPLILASPEFDDALTKRLNDTHLMTGYFRLRRATFFELWVRMDLWKEYITNKKTSLAK